jgi:hypothetical protein
MNTSWSLGPGTTVSESGVLARKCNTGRSRDHSFRIWSISQEMQYRQVQGPQSQNLGYWPGDALQVGPGITTLGYGVLARRCNTGRSRAGTTVSESGVLAKRCNTGRSRDHSLRIWCIS